MKKIHIFMATLGLTVLLSACGLGTSAKLKQTTDTLNKKETFWQKDTEDKTGASALISADGELYGGGHWQAQSADKVKQTIKKSKHHTFSLKEVNRALASSELKKPLKSLGDLALFRAENADPQGVLASSKRLYAVSLSGVRGSTPLVQTYEKANKTAPEATLSSEALYGTWRASGEPDVLVTDEQLYVMNKPTVERTAVENLAAKSPKKLYASKTFANKLQQTLEAGIAMPRATTLGASTGDRTFVFLSPKKLAVITKDGKRIDYTKFNSVIGLNAWPTGIKKAFSELDTQVKDTQAFRITPNGTKTFKAEMAPSLNGLTDERANQTTAKKDVLIWNAGVYDTKTRALITDAK